MSQSTDEEWLPLRGRWLEYFWRGLGVLCLALVLSNCSIHPPGSLRQTEKGQPGAAVTQLRNFKTAIELYAADHGRPPADLKWLIAPSYVIPSVVLWKGPYLQDVTSVPLDPWQNPFQYEAPGPHGEPYWILSYGSDGRPGGQGTAADLTPDSAVNTESWLPSWYHPVTWR